MPLIIRPLLRLRMTQTNRIAVAFHWIEKNIFIDKPLALSPQAWDPAGPGPIF